MNNADFVDTPKWMKPVMKLLALLFIICAVVGGCSSINRKLGLKDDNAAEQILESLIESQTGLDIDLTPE